MQDEANKMDLIIEFFASDKVDLSSLNATEFIKSLKITDDFFKNNLEILGDICLQDDIGILYQALDFKGPLFDNEGVRTNLIINFIQKSGEPINQRDFEKFKIFIKDEEKLDRITKTWEKSQKPLIQTPRLKIINETLQSEKSIQVQVSALLGSAEPQLASSQPRTSTQVIESISINEGPVSQIPSSHHTSTRRSFNSCCSIG